MTCDQLDRAFEALAAGDLDAAGATELRRHARTCPRCRALRATLGHLPQLLGRDLGGPLVRESRRRLRAAFVRARLDPVRYATISTALGPVTVARSAAGICHVSFGHAEEASLRRRLGRLAPEVVRDDRALRPAAGEIEGYLQGARHRFSVEVDLRNVTRFTRRVLRAASRIPFGGVVAYAELARRVGRPGGARAVGQALGRNPVPLFVPCHRVVTAAAGPGGYVGGTARKRRLLALEGHAARWR